MKMRDGITLAAVWTWILAVAVDAADRLTVWSQITLNLLGCVATVFVIVNGARKLWKGWGVKGKNDETQT